MSLMKRTIVLFISLFICLAIILMIKGNNKSNIQIDHVIWAVPDLDEGARLFEELSGIKPAVGGVHPGRGTRNNVVSAGEKTYLEIIAPDPAQEPFNPEKYPVKAFASKISEFNEPEVDMFVYSTDNLEAAAEKGRELGFEVVGPIEGSRKTPEGKLVRWTHVDFIGHDFGQFIPFAINWGESVHPSVTSPKGVLLTGVTIEHPRYEELGKIYKTLGVPARVVKGDFPVIIIHLKSPNGRFEIRSGKGLLDYYKSKDVSNF